MAKRDLSKLLSELSKLKTEESILECLIKIVRGFNPSEYKDVVFSNPYYRSLLPEIKDFVLKEISVLKNSISEEINGIDIELKKVDNENEKTLKELKKDCLSMIYEIDERLAGSFCEYIVNRVICERTGSDYTCENIHHNLYSDLSYTYYMSATYYRKQNVWSDAFKYY